MLLHTSHNTTSSRTAVTTRGGQRWHSRIQPQTSQATLRLTASRCAGEKACSDGEHSGSEQEEKATPKRRVAKPAAGKSKRILDQSASDGEADDAYVAPSKPQATKSFYHQVRIHIPGDTACCDLLPGKQPAVRAFELQAQEGSASQHCSWLVCHASLAVQARVPRLSTK